MGTGGWGQLGGGLGLGELGVRVRDHTKTYKQPFRFLGDRGVGTVGTVGGGVGVRGIRVVRVRDCVHTLSSYVISNSLGELGGLGNGITQRHTNNPLGFWVGTVGGGAVMGIRGVRVRDCVHTLSSDVISNSLGFWVGTAGWGQWGGVGVRRIRGVRVGDCVHTLSSYVLAGFWVGTGGWGQWGGLGCGGGDRIGASSPATFRDHGKQICHGRRGPMVLGGEARP